MTSRKKSRHKDLIPTGPRSPAIDDVDTTALVSDLRELIESAKERTASAVNSELVMLYWRIGRRISEDILGHQRAEYGKKIVQTLSGQLTRDYGKGFGHTNLFRMIRFAEYFQDEGIVATLSQQLGWSHFKTIIPLDDPLQREFYAEMCRVERWSVRTLRAKIQGMLFERTAISRKPEDFAKQELAKLQDADKLTPDLVFRDPYLLDFLGLANSFSEKDLESAILRELERFLMELGTDFAFVARQKRMTVDDEDYYLDLLFYHRRLRRLVAIELKLGKLRAADKGQMELYLAWLDKYERQPGEDAPVGLILCAGTSRQHVELLRLEQSGIRVGEYLTELPPREVLSRKLGQAIKAAKERVGSSSSPNRCAKS